MSLLRDRRGSVATEFIVAFGPLTLFFFAIWQESLLTSGQSLTQHAAIAAARSATVVLADDPVRYGGSPANTVSPARADAVRAAAVRALGPLVFDDTVSDVQVTFPGTTGVIQPGQDITVRVTATFQCALPLVRSILCDASGSTRLVADATLPVHAARYTY